MSQKYYKIEKILERRKNLEGNYEYKIKWDGYPINQSTWEPIEHLQNAMPLVEEYDKQNPKNKDEELSRDKEGTNNYKKKKIIEEISNENNVNEESLKNKKERNEKEENSDENSKILIYENVNTYIVNNSFIRVVRVRQENGKLMAIVEKKGENGKKCEVFIPTEELRKFNPWILLEFYESKIKFK